MRQTSARRSLNRADGRGFRAPVFPAAPSFSGMKCCMTQEWPQCESRRAASALSVNCRLPESSRQMTAWSREAAAQASISLRSAVTTACWPAAVSRYAAARVVAGEGSGLRKAAVGPFAAKVRWEGYPLTVTKEREKSALPSSQEQEVGGQHDNDRAQNPAEALHRFLVRNIRIGRCQARDAHD